MAVVCKLRFYALIFFSVALSVVCFWSVEGEKVTYSMHRFSRDDFKANDRLERLLKLHRLQGHVKHALEEYTNGYEIFLLAPEQPPKLTIPMELNCDGSPEAEAKSCSTETMIFNAYLPSNEVEKREETDDLRKFCEEHVLKEEDCLTLFDAMQDKQKAWEEEQNSVTVVPLAFLFMVIHSAEKVFETLNCQVDMQSNWMNHSVLYYAEHHLYREVTCHLAKNILGMGSLEPWGRYYEPNQSIFSKEQYDIQHMYAFSSELPIRDMHDLGTSLAMMGSARSNDTWPPTETQIELFDFSIIFLEGVLKVEPRSYATTQASALVRLCLNDFNAASAHFTHAGMLKRPFPANSPLRAIELDGQLFSYRSSGNQGSGYPSRFGVPFKIRNDGEQIRHLIDIGVFERSSWLPIALEYEQLFKEWSREAVENDSLGNHHVGRLIPAEYAHVLETFGRVLNVRPTPALWPKAAALGSWDGELVSTAYSNAAPGMAVIDDFLSPVALEELFLFATQSTLFHGQMGGKTDRAYLGAYMEHGFAPGLLFQIVSELRQRMPHIIGKYKLTQAWAYKYMENVDQGIQVHADEAAVNVNFWITPDHANLLPLEGGLDVFDKESPADWSFQDANKNAKKIFEFLEAEPKATKTSVPYKQNRCIMFHSNLFHRTGNIKFKRGYLNRRINFTLLFGARKSTQKSS